MELIVLLFLKLLFACWETKNNGGKYYHFACNYLLLPL